MHENPFSIIIKIASSKENLTCRQLAVLSFVYKDNQRASVKEYAQRLNISKPAITRSLDRLEELTFIQREIDKMDKRQIIVNPTPVGQEFYNQLITQ